MRRRDRLAAYLFIAPQLAGTVVFVLVPLVLVVWYSLHEWNVLAGTFAFTGADNYRKLLDDPNVAPVLRATLYFSAGLVIFNLTLALLLAVLLNQKLLVYYLYQQAFQFHAFGYGATLSVLPFVIVLVLTVVQWQLRKRWAFYEA
jgi:multiple sugar transport system permease protein